MRTQSLALALVVIQAGVVVAQTKPATDTLTREEKWRADLRPIIWRDAIRSWKRS